MNDHNGGGFCCYCGTMSKAEVKEVNDNKVICEGCCKLFDECNITKTKCCGYFICDECGKWLCCCEKDGIEKGLIKKQEYEQVSLFDILDY